jgi:glycerophosphoryl diester phosphodiesterase
MRFILLLFLTFSVLGITEAQVKIAGHRGGYYHSYAESSLPLFEFIAAQFGSDTIMIEIDLRESKYGTLFLRHDEMVNRTTTGEGKIGDLTDEYLNSLYLKKTSGEITSQRIPTFEDVLYFIKDRNINLMLDIKEPIHAEVLEQVKRHNLENRMLVLTFRMELTQQVSTRSQKILLSTLIETNADWEAASQLPIRNRVAYINTKTPTSLISKMRKHGVKIMADISEDTRHNSKPLPEESYRKQVRDMQLDILISDFPIEARKAFKIK